MVSEKDLDLLAECYRHSKGRGWEPDNPHHPFFDRMITAGYVRRADGRFLFERFKDSHIVFTDAGLAAIQARIQTKAAA